MNITALPVAAAAPLAAMHAACFPEDPWDPAAMQRILALAGCFGYLAWLDDEPAGFILARDLGGESEILSLGVLPPRRRQGIAAALLAAVITEASRRCGSAIVLEVAADNDAARCLYAGNGFTRVGARPRYYRRPQGYTDALILRRSIIGEAPHT